MGTDAHRAVALFSGGLDSALAARLVLDQGVEVLGIHFTSVFCASYSGGALPERVGRCAGEVGIPMAVEEVTDELIALVKSPPHGHGSNLNPCIDCRIMCLRRAWRHAESQGAGFLVTGEVLGQRPMSQRRQAIRVIESETGLEGRILRPLSAKCLPPTEAERRGIVDRTRLLGIRGRGRRAQIALAAGLGIESYATPAGGCFLTEIDFSAKLRDLLEHDELDAGNVLLLRCGRHFRGPGGELIVVGRDQESNDRLLELVRAGDEILSAPQSSPITILRPGGSPEAREAAARVTARYCKDRGSPEVEVLYGASFDEWSGSLMAAPADEALLAALRPGSREVRSR